MAALALTLLWADQSEAAAFKAGHIPGPTTFGSSCSSPALFVTGLLMIHEKRSPGRCVAAL